MKGATVTARVEILDNLFSFFGFDVQAADFTEGEQECISTKIKKLRDEGKEQAESVAFAISECAPDKAKASASIQDMIMASHNQTKNPEVVGGGYRAVENPDGTFNIQDVPVFASHTRTLPDGRQIKIDRPWLESALKSSMKRFAEDQYLAPLHIQHHEFGKDVRRAGFFKLRRVRRATYEGKPVWLAYADLVGVPAEIYNMIRAGQLPYRSVEILNVGKKEIDSLALLDHEVPYFRLPNLTIGEEFKCKTAHRAVRCSGKEPMLAYRAKDRSGCSVLLDFGEETMDKVRVFAQEEEDVDEAKKRLEEENDQDDVQADADGGADVDREGILEILQNMGEGVQLLIEKLGQQPTAEEPDDGGESAPAPVEMKATPAIHRSAEETVGVYNGSSKPAALMARLDALETERDLDKTVSDAKRELVRYGVSEVRVENRVREIMAVDGPKAVKVYVSTVKEHARPDPPTHIDGIAGILGTADDKDAAKFSDLGPKGVERASFYAAEFDRLSTQGKMTFSFPKADYIADCLREEGFKVKKAEGR